MESHWAALKRGYAGVYHHMSAKHLPRYVTEFAGRHNSRLWTLPTKWVKWHEARTESS